jgi:hypothetical protein
VVRPDFHWLISAFVVWLVFDWRNTEIFTCFALWQRQVKIDRLQAELAAEEEKQESLSLKRKQAEQGREDSVSLTRTGCVWSLELAWNYSLAFDFLLNEFCRMSVKQNSRDIKSWGGGRPHCSPNCKTSVKSTRSESLIWVRL